MKLRFSSFSHRWPGADPGRGRTRRASPLKFEKIWFFGVKSWLFTRNTPKIFAPPIFLSAPSLTWNPGSAPDDISWFWLSYLGPLVLLLPELYITCIWISNLSIFESNLMKVIPEASCALNLISTFLFN
jgi:hypothetical protein